MQSGVGEELGFAGFERARIKSHKSQKGEEKGEKTSFLAVWAKSAFSLALSFDGKIFQPLSILFKAWELRQGSGSFVLMSGHVWVIPGWVMWTLRPKAPRTGQSRSTRAQPEQPVSKQPFPDIRED